MKKVSKKILVAVFLTTALLIAAFFLISSSSIIAQDFEGFNHPTGFPQETDSCAGCHRAHTATMGKLTACEGCHSYPAGNDQGTYKGSKTHKVHAETYKFACKTCHFDLSNHNGSGVSSAADWEEKFDRSEVDVQFDSSINPAPATAYDSGQNKKCANLYCHGQSGSVNAIDFSFLGGTNQSGNVPTWDNGAAQDYGFYKNSGACGTCHDTFKENNPAEGYPLWGINDWSTTPGTVFDMTQFTSLGDAPVNDSHKVHLDDPNGPKALCNVCHPAPPTVNAPEPESGTYVNKHVNKIFDGSGGVGGSACIACHGHDEGYEYETGKLSLGKGTSKVHSTHTEKGTDDDPADARGPNLQCSACHDTDNFPNFADGVSYSDYKQGNAMTTVCNDCHSAGGLYNGLTDPDIGAKYNWENGVYNDGGSLKTGKDAWCVTCHDNEPSVVRNRLAPNKLGDNLTYGYFITGHGKSGIYPTMSWQDSLAFGNPGANITSCGDCHDSRQPHINGADPDAIVAKRFEDQYQNDQNNSNCNKCHKAQAQGGIAFADPQFYTNSSEFENSAHKGKICTDCHDVHGTISNGIASTFTAMTKGNKEDLCNQCHGPAHAGHSLGTQFTNQTNGKTYKLACTSCHNVHVLSGTPTNTDKDKSPVTKLSDITDVWGALPSQKMFAFAATGGGIYRTPNGDTLSGDALPDYDSFCTDCHGSFYLWGAQGQDSHFYNTAGAPAGGNLSPDQYSFGKAFGWDGDDITDESKAWPVISRGLGEQNFIKPAYDQKERIEGKNYVLSCTDCHTVHDSGIGAKLKNPINSNNHSGAGEWKTLCGACHWFYNTDPYSGDGGSGHTYATGGSGLKGCGSASCHEFNSIHQAKKLGFSWGTTDRSSTDKNLVLDMRFDDPSPDNLAMNNAKSSLGVNYLNYLKDYGPLRLHGRWRGPAWDTDWGSAAGGTGSWTTDRNGTANKAIEISNQPIEVGTRNDQWSTEEGPRDGTSQWGHGTWKYSEMKNNTTLEAWVNPTDSSSPERIIATKQLLVSDWDLFDHAKIGAEGLGAGGYKFILRKVNGAYRAALQVNVNGGLGTDPDNPTDFGYWDPDSNGWRGAYSSTTVPLNNWTHVAAIFDKNGGDKRVRVYVNGEDVTTSSSDIASGWAQPQANETSIFPYSRHNIVGDNVSTDPNYKKNPWGYRGQWTATPFSVGGFNWSDTGKNFIGKLDEVKLWNITQSASYFNDLDEQIAPKIDRVEGVVGSDKLYVTFSEGVWGSIGKGSPLSESSFMLGDGDGRTIYSVNQTAQDKATVTLSYPLDADDIGLTTLAAQPLSIWDDYDNYAATTSVAVSFLPGEPVGATIFQLNETAGSNYVLEAQGVVSAQVYDGPTAPVTMGGGYFNGNGVDNFIRSLNGDTAFKASRKMSLEARFKSYNVGGGDNTTNTQRIFNRTTGGAHYQISLWRNTTSTYPNFDPPDGVTSIAFWLRPLNVPTGDFTWKPVLTDYTNYPIRANRWYKVRVVWDSDNVGQIPAEIYLDDQGPNGDNAEDGTTTWSGYVNATKADQSYVSATRRVYIGDEIKSDEDGPFSIGVNSSPDNLIFNGLIDWISWSPSAVRPPGSVWP